MNFGHILRDMKHYFLFIRLTLPHALQYHNNKIHPFKENLLSVDDRRCSIFYIADNIR